MDSREETSNDPFSKPIFLLITGANRGYGFALAKCAMPRLKEGSLILISGRNNKELEEAKVNLCKNTSFQNIEIATYQADLSVEKDYSLFLENAVDEKCVSKYTKFMLINNAGTLGDVTLRMDQYSNANAITQYMNLNVCATMFLTSRFVNKYARDQNQCFIVNISSLLAIQPLASCALYCTGKAARDMMFKVLAEERKDVRILNWAPGPMPTQMMESLKRCCEPDSARMFQDMAAKKSFVECSDSAEKLFSLLQRNEFKSGDHVDYYDV